MIVSLNEIIDAQWLSDTFLVGVDLTLDDGTPYPDIMFETAIQSAFDMLEHTLGIKISPMNIKNERHDAYDWERAAFWPFRLDFRPVLSMAGLYIKYGSFESVTIPTSWIQLISKEHGQINLIASAESLGSYFFRMGIPLIGGGAMQTIEQIPGYFYFDYRAGFHGERGDITFAVDQSEGTIPFEQEFPNNEYSLRLTETDPITGVVSTAAGGMIGLDKDTESATFHVNTPPTEETTYQWTATGVPQDLLYCVGLLAAMLPLDIAGDLIAGAGIASKSIGVDGLHASVNTTSSATNSGYGARVLQFERELKVRIPALLAKYRSLNFGSF